MTKNDTNMNYTNSEQSRKLNKSNVKMYIYISCVIVVLITLTTIYVIGNNYYSSESKIESFEEALINKQPDELRHLLQTNHEHFDITVENSKSLLSYLTNNDEIKDDLIDKWKKQAEGKMVSREYGSIDLVIAGKKWLLFNDYQFEVTPAYLHPMANSSSIDFYLNEIKAEKLAPLTENGYGPLMPGQYEILAKFDNSYIVSEQSTKIDLYNSQIEEIVHTFDFPVEEVVVNSIYEGYNLKINDEITDNVIAEGEQSIGEFPTDGSVTIAITKAYPWGEVTSKAETVNTAEIVEFEVEHTLTNDVKQSLMTTMNTVFTEYQDVLNTGNPSILTNNVTPNLIKQLKNRVDEVNNRYPGYEGTLVKVIYDSEKIAEPVYDEELKAYTMTLTAHHVFHEPNRNLGWLFMDRERDEYTRSNELTILYNEEAKEWQLDGYRTSYSVIPTANEIIFEL